MPIDEKSNPLTMLFTGDTGATSTRKSTAKKSSARRSSTGAKKTTGAAKTGAKKSTAKKATAKKTAAKKSGAKTAAKSTARSAVKKSAAKAGAKKTAAKKTATRKAPAKKAAAKKTATRKTAAKKTARTKRDAQGSGQAGDDRQAGFRKDGDTLVRQVRRQEDLGRSQDRNSQDRRTSRPHARRAAEPQSVWLHLARQPRRNAQPLQPAAPPRPSGRRQSAPSVPRRPARARAENEALKIAFSVQGAAPAASCIAQRKSPGLTPGDFFVRSTADHRPSDRLRPNRASRCNSDGHAPPTPDRMRSRALRRSGAERPCSWSSFKLSS